MFSISDKIFKYLCMHTHKVFVRRNLNHVSFYGRGLMVKQIQCFGFLAAACKCKRERERENEGGGPGVIVQHHKHWCSSRGCRVSSLHLHVSQQPSTTPVSGDPIPSSSLQGSILMGTQIQRHTCRQTPVRIK